MHDFFSKFNKNIYAKLSTILILSLFVLTTLAFLGIKYFVSYSFVEKKFNDLTNLKLEFIEPNSNFDYRFNLNTKAKEINIYNEEKTTKFITLKNPSFTFKPIGFLFNRVYFKKLAVDDIKININRNSKGEVDIIKALKSFDKLTNKNLALTRLDLNIGNIDLVFNDSYKTKSTTKLNLKNTSSNISKRKKELYFHQIGIIETSKNNKKQIANLIINASSKYPFSNIESNNLNLNINLDNIDLFIFSDLAKKYISKDIDSLEGSSKLNIKSEKNYQKLNLKLFNPTLKLKEKTVSPYKENIDLAAFFTLNKNKINFWDLKIKSKDLDILSNGEIIDFFAKKPKCTLNINIKNTQINKIIPFIPDNAIFYRPKGIPTLKKTNFHALADGKLEVKLFPLNIKGNLKAQNVHIPSYPKPYKQNDVNAIFMGDKVRILTRIFTPDNEYVSVDGISNLDNSLWGKYSVKSTSKIDLAFAQLYLVPIQQIIGFNIGPVPIMDISGYGNININTQGTIDDAQIFGNFNAYNANAKIEGLSAKLTQGKCNLVFDNKDIIFKELKGKLDGADFILSGKSNTSGDISLNAKIKNAYTDKILETFNNSLISKPYTKLTSNIQKITGKLEADINLSGKIKNFEDPSFFTTLTPSGNINLKDTDFILNNKIKINKLSGYLNFGEKQKGQFRFNIKDSTFNSEFSSNDNISKISKGENFNLETLISSNKIIFNNISQMLLESDFLNKTSKNLLNDFSNINFYSKLFLKSEGQASLNSFNAQSFKHNGYLIGLNSSETNSVKFDSGIVKISNNKLIFDNLKIKTKEGNLKANGNIYNITSKNPLGDLEISLNDIKLDELNKIFPKLKSSNAKINNGQIIFKNNNLKLNSLSINYSDTPFFLNANLKDIYSAKLFDSDFSTILNEKSADDLINPYLISPLKITGEIPIKGSFKGNIENYFLDFSASIPKNSDISFSGANLGDFNHKRELQGNISVSNNIAKINNLKLIKHIANQNNKINPIVALKANGKIIQNGNSFSYDDFKIATNSPINVRILNLIFKKSILKKGNFDCNISLNGNTKLPKTSGKVNLYDLDIPLYNTKIDNVKINISNSFIDGEVTAKNKQSDVKINFHALNKLTMPYIVKDVVVRSNNLNINEILSSISPTQNKTDIIPKNEISLKPDDIIIEKGSFDFKDVQYNKINAQNLKGKLNYKNNIANLDNMTLDIAQGTIFANGTYDTKTTKLNLEAKMLDCDSNILTKDFLNLPNQIFGKMDGTLSLSGKNLYTFEGINSIKSDINFSIDNGKMPKLGSLEYLLRAGNLFKNGILGLSLNNLIEVLTPYKTGEFEKISGNLTIANGEIETLNILSKGKNLSLFLDGNYSILENFADIKIYGKLSQNISNALGAIGNASINQLFEAISQVKRNKNEKDTNLQQILDKIPSIENESNPRYFKARVLGDINKDNYIKGFDWI